MNKAVSVIAVIATCVGSAALAHHSFAVFDQSRTEEITGTVKAFQYTNPHSWIELLVKKPDGALQEWGFEGQPPSQLRGRGWTPTSLKPGDTVTISFSPRKDGSPQGSFRSVKRANGEMIGQAGPPRARPGKPGGPGGPPDSTGHPTNVPPLLAALVPRLMFSDVGPGRGPGSQLSGTLMAPTKDPRDLDGRYWPGGGLLMPGGKTRMMPYNDVSAAIFKQRAEDFLAGKSRRDPPTICVPSGPVRPLNQGFPVQITVTPKIVSMIFMEDHITRTIHMDRGHPAALKPTVMGDSIGHWEGGTLVVDTVGVRDGGWLDEYGSPSSAKLHVVERYTKQANGDLKLEAVLTDPTYYTKPAPFTRILSWNPGAQWDEVICEENNRDAPGAAK